MSDRTGIMLTTLALLGAGLVAGVFFGFSTFIMRALDRLPTDQSILAMQSINITVITPLFMAVLFGTGLLGAYLAVVAFRFGLDAHSGIIMFAALAYIIGVIGVTLVFSVPLNDGLASLQAQSTDAASYWKSFVASWTYWNHVRCGFAILSCLAFASALRA